MSLSRLGLMVLALAGAVGLAISNPTTDDYLQFVEEELSKAIDGMDQHTPSREQRLLREVFRSHSKKLIEGIVRPSTVRHNWGLLSRFDTQVADTQVVVIGISGLFVPIRGVEEVTLKIGRMVF